MNVELPPNIQKSINKLIDIDGSRIFFPVSEALINLSGQISENLNSIKEQLEPIGLIFVEIGKHFQNSEKSKKLISAGWIPYAGMNFDDIPINSTNDELSRIMNDKIDGEWTLIRERLKNIVSHSGVDDEAQETFLEALDAFESGFFRSVVRVLFPEIERVACQTVYGGSRKDWSFQNDSETRGQNTSLKAVREALWEKLPAGVGLQADLGFSLIEVLNQHLYAHVGSTEEDMEKFLSNPIPNRHASLHGFVSYNTRQNAFNALTMTAFMFEIIIRIYRYYREEEDVSVETSESQS